MMSLSIGNKKELLLTMRMSFYQVKAEFDTIPLARAKQVLMPGHNAHRMMSVHDLLAYLVGWCEGVLERVRVWTQEHRIPLIPNSKYGALALAFYQKYQDFDFPELLLYFESKFEELYEKVEHLSETDLYETIRYRTKAGNAYTAGRLIALNTTAPYRNARIRLRKWKKEHQKSDF